MPDAGRRNWRKWMVGCVVASVGLMVLGAWAVGPRTLRPYVHHLGTAEVAVRWGDVEMSSEAGDLQVMQICEAAARAKRPVSYAPKCLHPAEPDRYSITFRSYDGVDFEVWLGVMDDCGSVYAPSLDKTYHDFGGLTGLVRARALDKGLADPRD